MARYTNVGPGLFDWPSYHALGYSARCLWLGLYASAEAKRLLPGLFHGGPSVMAEAAAMSAIDVDTSLRELVDRGLVVYEPTSRLTVFLKLPDRGERPCNGRMLKMFWMRWRDLPEARPKYLWVPLLEWLCEPMTVDHVDVWQHTFGSIDTIKLTNQDTVSYTVSDTLRHGTKLSTGELQQDLFCRSPSSDDQKLSTGEFELSTSEVGSVSKLVVADTVWHTPQCQYSVPESPEGGSGGISGGGHNGRAGPGGKYTHPGRTPNAFLAGSHHGFTVKDLCETLEKASAGRVLCGVVDPRSGPMLWDTIAALEGLGMGLGEVELAGKFLAAGGLAYRDDLDAKWVGSVGNLVGVVAQAKRWDQSGRPDLRVATEKRTSSPLAVAAKGLQEIAAWAETGYDSNRRDLVSPRTLKAVRSVGGVWELQHTSDVGRWRYQFAAAYAAEKDE